MGIKLDKKYIKSMKNDEKTKKIIKILVFSYGIEQPRV